MCPTLKESDESGMTAATQQKVTKDVSRSALSLSLSLTHSLALCGCLCGIMGLLSLWEHNTHTHTQSLTITRYIYMYGFYGILWHLWDVMGLITRMIAYYLFTSGSLSVEEESISCRCHRGRGRMCGLQQKVQPYQGH